jgi:hypothetical protein
VILKEDPFMMIMVPQASHDMVVDITGKTVIIFLEILKVLKVFSVVVVLNLTLIMKDKIRVKVEKKK